MDRDRSPQVLGAALAIGWMVVLVAVDIAIPDAKIVLTSFFSVAPLVACALLPPVTTGAIAAVSVGLTIASGVWDGIWGRGQQTIRILDVA
ncbi:MAG TPA: hypothetical protein VFJ09_15110, partial [Nocardioidaceae bacterium]|nr:hypothetical protein [Nocardioidaceae bacterium]